MKDFTKTTREYMNVSYFLDALESGTGELAIQVDGEGVTPLSSILDDERITADTINALKVYLIELHHKIINEVNTRISKITGEALKPYEPIGIPKNDHRRCGTNKEEDDDRR